MKGFVFVAAAALLTRVGAMPTPPDFAGVTTTSSSDAPAWVFDVDDDAMVSCYTDDTDSNLRVPYPLTLVRCVKYEQWWRCEGPTPADAKPCVYWCHYDVDVQTF